MYFFNVNVCAILSDDRIDNRAVKTLITKIAEEWVMINPVDSRKMRLSKEYSSSASFIFVTDELKEFRSECRILKGFPTKVWLGSAIDIQLKS